MSDGGTRKQFTPEFKREAVQLLESRPQAGGPAQSTLSNGSGSSTRFPIASINSLACRRRIGSGRATSRSCRRARVADRRGGAGSVLEVWTLGPDHPTANAVGGGGWHCHRPVPRLIHHSDQSNKYRATLYQTLLAKLKNESVRHQRFENQAEPAMPCLHQALGYRSPEEFE